MKLFAITCLFVLITGSSIGCSTDNETEDASKGTSQNHSAYMKPEAGAGETGHQYRAVCLEKEAHAGNVQVLSRWLDDRQKAYELGNYHGEFKDKGHRWIIEDRVNP
jgi:hypothetical protein